MLGSKAKGEEKKRSRKGEVKGFQKRRRWKKTAKNTEKDRLRYGARWLIAWHGGESAFECGCCGVAVFLRLEK